MRSDENGFIYSKIAGDEMRLCWVKKDAALKIREENTEDLCYATTDYIFNELQWLLKGIRR